MVQPDSQDNVPLWCQRMAQTGSQKQNFKAGRDVRYQGRSSYTLIQHTGVECTKGFLGMNGTEIYFINPGNTSRVRLKPRFEI